MTQKTILRVALYLATVLAVILLAASVLNTTVIAIHWVKAVLGLALLVAIVAVYLRFARGNRR